MIHGRIIRVTFSDGKTALYAVAEEDAAAAEKLLAAGVPGAELQQVGLASLRLLLTMFLSPGEFKRTDE